MTAQSTFALATGLALSMVLTSFAVFGAGPPGGLDVTVINDPDNPIPVTIDGTSVVTGSVAITNTPTVKIAGEPYAVRVNGDCNTTFCFFNTYPQVPAAKRLVITYISVLVRPTLTTTIVDLAQLSATDTILGNNNARYYFGFTQIGRAGASNVFNSWAVSSPVLAFVAAGGSPRVEVGLQNNGAISVAEATLTGYLVDAP